MVHDDAPHISTEARSPPVSAEARGKRRLWKQIEAARFARVLATFRDPEVAKAAREFVRRNGRHVACSLILHRFDSCANPEHVDLKARPPQMVWTAIDASPESPLRDTDEHTLTMEERQAASSLHYVMAGVKTGVLIRGLWTSSYSDHAVGRLLQRWPNADVSAVIREGHSKLLRVPERNFIELAKLGRFVLPTSEGGWWCSAEPLKSVEKGHVLLHVRARSWLSDAQIRQDQIRIATELLTLRPGDVPAGSTLFHPFTLRGAVGPQG
jgi:hypothetical protein